MSRRLKPIVGNLAVTQESQTLRATGNVLITGTGTVKQGDARLGGEAAATLRPLAPTHARRLEAIDRAIRELLKHGEIAAAQDLQQTRQALIRDAVDAARQQHRPVKPGTARAVRAVLTGMSVAEAARSFGLVRRTLKRHVDKARRK